MWRRLLMSVFILILAISGLALKCDCDKEKEEEIDVDPPVISEVTVTGITESSCTISWITDLISSSQVEYGTTSSYGISTTYDDTRITSHSIELTGLTEGTTYHFRVISYNGESYNHSPVGSSILDNTTYSIDNTFITQAASDIIHIDILNHSSYVETMGYYDIVGEVKNTGVNNLISITITATFYDSSDDFIDTALGYTDVDILIPNQKSPFKIISLNPLVEANMDYYTLEITNVDITEEEPYTGLQILNHSHNIDSSGYYQILGEVKNNGDEVANSTKLVATYYNSDGIVIAAESRATNPWELSIGQTVSFEITLYENSLSTKIDNYVLQAQCS